MLSKEEKSPQPLSDKTILELTRPQPVGSYEKEEETAKDWYIGPLVQNREPFGYPSTSPTICRIRTKRVGWSQLIAPCFVCAGSSFISIHLGYWRWNWKYGKLLDMIPDGLCELVSITSFCWVLFEFYKLCKTPHLPSIAAKFKVQTMSEILLEEEYIDVVDAVGTEAILLKIKREAMVAPTPMLAPKPQYLAPSSPSYPKPMVPAPSSPSYPKPTVSAPSQPASKSLYPALDELYSDHESKSELAKPLKPESTAKPVKALIKQYRKLMMILVL